MRESIIFRNSGTLKNIQKPDQNFKTATKPRSLKSSKSARICLESM
ncbi:hypothetical protein LEP1GSC179_4127 [Leptospira santarosai str. MOR084]|uniref:Uncharacterized protein n=1 Tax=Leptospira santarosai str. MOR084 TaxID=1049984 RepID=A0A0E2BD06_9LEPT|nr:hypothetical protein LEP1GSC179_4127 [Leptospira santarosai str. MOR084]